MNLNIEVSNPLLFKPSECPICLEDMWAKVTLECGHEFHFKCIDAWFGRKLDCPMCRCPFLPPPSPVSSVDSNVASTSSNGWCCFLCMVR